MGREDMVVRITDDADTAVRIIGDQVLDVAGAPDPSFVAIEGGLLVPRALVDADIPATIARDAEVAAAVAAAVAAEAVLRAAGDAALALPYLHPGGYYYPTTLHQLLTVSGALGTGSFRAHPFYVPRAVTLTRIGAEVTIVGDGTSVYRLGIYADDGQGLPGALVLDAGTIVGNSATVQEKIIDLDLTPGWYWAGGAVQLAAVVQPTMRTVSPTYGLSGPLGTVIPTAGLVTGGVVMSGTTGALPTPFVVASFSGTQPRMFVKVE